MINFNDKSKYEMLCSAEHRSVPDVGFWTYYIKKDSEEVVEIWFDLEEMEVTITEYFQDFAQFKSRVYDRPYADFSEKNLKFFPEGFVSIFFSLLLCCFCIFVGLVIDLGFTVRNQRALQQASDAAVMAAVMQLQTNDTQKVFDEARNIFNSNANGTITQLNVGNWRNGQFVSNANPLNAVYIKAGKIHETFFGRLVNILTMQTSVEAVAAIGNLSMAQCLIPYGVLDSLLTNKISGDPLIIETNGQGNWGKLDIGGNMSSRGDFLTAVQEGICNHPVSLGQPISPGTGNSGVKEAFEYLIQYHPIVIIPVVNNFGDGNSENSLILGFVQVELLSESHNGNNWTFTGTIVKTYIGGTFVGESIEPYAYARTLVK